MAGWVDKAVCTHEAEIFRLVVGRAARGNRLGDETVTSSRLSQLRLSKTSTALLVSQTVLGVKSRELACAGSMLDLYVAVKANATAC
jgi:hypothetical protein